MSDVSEDVSPELETDPLAPSLGRSFGCAMCGEKYLRVQDRDVHQERHKPVPQLSKEEREGSVHCPKGCGRLMVPGNPDGEAHAALCDGSPPIVAKPKKSAYHWWCEEHHYGTNGPRPWGDHKREHHDGQVPVGAVIEKKAGKKVGEKINNKGTVIGEVIILLQKESARLDIERGKINGELARVAAAIKALETDLRTETDHVGIEG